MKIGITERGDAGLNYSWTKAIENEQVEGAVLITKRVYDKFNEKVLDLYNLGYTNLIVHCTCTGWGSSVVEPNVLPYEQVLSNLKSLVDGGFPIENCVLRIDPIFPTEKGIKRVCEVIEKAYELKLLPAMRVRISVLDEYKHVKERFTRLGYGPMYGNTNFHATKEMFDNVAKALEQYQDITYECCAEPELSKRPRFEAIGCISEKDLKIMRIKSEQMSVNPQNRNGCLCLSCKTEILNQGCKQCEHKCAYCYWKD